MSNSAKRHHYLSQCYLMGFVNNNNQLTTLNLSNGKIFHPGPHNVGVEAYFNGFEAANGVMNNEFESARAQFESDVAKALCNINKTEQFESKDKITIFNLMSLFSVSNPFRRAQNNAMIDSLVKHGLRIAAHNVGHKVNGILITEELKKIIEEDKFEIKVPKRTHIYGEYFKYFEMILSTMFYRKWTVVKASDEDFFVTCDCPVALIWKNPKKISC